MAAKLGRAFAGYHTREQEWEKWASVTEPELSSALVLADRRDAAEKLSEWLASPPTEPFRVFADSRDEAAAFVCAALVEHKKYADRLIVVRSNPDEAHKMLNAEGTPQPVFLFAEESDAAFALRRKAHVIIADARGGQREDMGQPGLLRRVSRESFIKAIVDMGCAEKEAEKLNRESGRSVSILRRQLAPQDSSIARPDWSKRENAHIMIAAALAGRWDGKSKYDLEFLSHLARMDYDAFEARVGEFLGGDDAPLEKKGDMWEVKSRIDSLLGVAELVVPTTMNRFWEKTAEMFGIHNPTLDLPKEVRFAADALYKKRTPYSGALLSSIADTLILLSVYHDRIIHCENVDIRVQILVQDILGNATMDRWRSLSGILRKLAEAAPNAFLDAVEKGLDPNRPAIGGMFSADAHSMFVPTYHTELLWGLEILAWDNEHLPRVIDALARMVNFELPSNLANRPDNSLLSFFRAWFPQCGANVDERIVRFEQLCKRHPEVAWKICPKLLNRWDCASHNPTPRWRDIPSRAHGRPINEERVKMLNAVIDATMPMAKNNTDKIIQILDIFTSLSSVEVTKRFIGVIEISMENASEADRSRVWNSVSNNLGKCRLWRSGDRPPVNSKWLEKITGMYANLREKIQPSDLVLRYERIFTDSFHRNLEFHEGDYHKQQKRLQESRKAAVREILATNEGESGVIRLAGCCNSAWLVGLTVGWHVAKDDKARMLWAGLARQSDMEDARKMAFMRGVFVDISEWKKFANAGFAQAKVEEWGDADIVLFALALRPCGEVWDALESSCSEEIRVSYWRSPKNNVFEKADVPRLVAETARVGDFGTALHYAAAYQFVGISADEVVRIMRAILALPEDENSKSIRRFGYDGYEIGRALSYANKSGIDKSVIAHLEWVFYSFLETADYEPKAIRSLLANDPAYFIQAVCSHSDANVSHRWWNVLGDWNIPPGVTDNGFDEKKFRTWVAEARDLAGKCGCLEEADYEIGRVLSHTPKGEDGIRPCEAVRRFLEEEGASDKIADGLQASIRSPKRMMTAQGNMAKQERKRASEHQKVADILHLRYPRTARIYRELAQQCLDFANWQDKIMKPLDTD